MAMNLECMLLLQKLGLLNSQKRRFLDIGPQNVYFCTVDQIGKFLVGQDTPDHDGARLAEIARLVYFSTPRPDERTTLFSEIADLANIEYNSFDVCPALKTELLDLNFDGLPAKYRNYYDVVTNFGTTEHIFNQWNCFSVIHGATKVGGTMYHVLPATGYLDHGYYCYTPLFFRDLAKANGYEIVDMFMAIAGVSKIDIDMRHEAQFDKSGSGATHLTERAIPSYNLHVIFRKRADTPFRAVLEVATAHAAVDERMNARYAGAPGADGHDTGPIVASPDQHDELLALVERLQSERDHLQRESDTRMRERDEKSAEILANGAHIQELTALVERLKSERDYLQRESDTRMKERDEKSAEILANGAHLQELTELAERLKSERDHLQRESDTRMRERDERFAEVLGREAHIQKLYQSTSWRVTKPLRSLAQLLRRGREG